MLCQYLLNCLRRLRPLLLCSLYDLLPCAFSPNQDLFFLLENSVISFRSHLGLLAFKTSTCLWPLHSIPWCPGILTSVNLFLGKSFSLLFIIGYLLAEYNDMRCVAPAKVRPSERITRTPWRSKEQSWQRAPSNQCGHYLNLGSYTTRGLSLLLVLALVIKWEVFLRLL